MKYEAFGHLCVGAAVGGLIGVLLAPQSGKEARAWVASKANKGADLVATQADTVRTAAADLMDRGKNVIKEQSDKLNTIVEAGKDAYQHALPKSS